MTGGEIGFPTPRRVSLAERTSPCTCFPLRCQRDVLIANRKNTTPSSSEWNCSSELWPGRNFPKVLMAFFDSFFFFFLILLWQVAQFTSRIAWNVASLPGSQASVFTQQLFLPPLGVTGHRAFPQSLKYRTETTSTKQQDENERDEESEVPEIGTIFSNYVTCHPINRMSTSVLCLLPTKS